MPDEQAIQIFSMYRKYAELFSIRLPRLSRFAFGLLAMVFGLGAWFRFTGFAIPFWLRIILPWVFLLAIVLAFISSLLLLHFPRRKTPEEAMRDRLAMDRTYVQKLRTYPAEARGHCLKYLRHFWKVEDARAKAWTAFTLTFGGLAAALPEWTGQPKGSFVFFIVVIYVAYIGLLTEQTVLAEAKRFGDLLEEETTGN